MAINIIKSGTWGACMWGIDDTGFMVIDEGLADSIIREDEVPWKDYVNKITEVKTKGIIELPANASLNSLFKDCVNLVKVDIQGINTFDAVDMRSMFENCSSLKALDLTSFNTENTENMSRMFYNCRELESLDLSTFETVKVNDMTNMFGKCKKLHGIILSDKFSVTGSGRTSCGKLAIRTTGKFKTAKVINLLGGTISYHENRGEERIETSNSLTGYRYVVEDVKFDEANIKYKFKEWNTRPDGRGEAFMPGMEIPSIENDLNLYAIWVCPPIVGKLETIDEITYGDVLPIKTPEVVVDNNKFLETYLEISSNGGENKWEKIDPNVVLPVKYNGYQVRFVAENISGRSCSNPIKITINKKIIDISNVYWAQDENMIYDGKEKRVWLEGMPNDVEVIYSNNTGIEAGKREARVELKYSENYDIPVKIEPFAWEIKKAKYDMSLVHWDYPGSFLYDGTEKSVSLVGVPSELTPHYEGCIRATNAGKMTAEAYFEYDEKNYEKIEKIPPCVWEIEKIRIDTSKLEWTDFKDFIYDGKPKEIKIENLPDDVAVKYYGNIETNAGKYLAKAVFIGNYYSDEPIEIEWNIQKAAYMITTVRWNYEEPFVFDDRAHKVELLNVPQSLHVTYYNNVGKDAGEYETRASFSCDDISNYSVPEDMYLFWSIKKCEIDMSNVKWSYTTAFEYDGSTKIIRLLNLPEDISATIIYGSAVNAGIYTAHAELQYNHKNYIVEQPVDCTWKINKKRYDMTAVHWNYEGPFVYDGKEKIVCLNGVPEGINVEYSNNVKVAAGKYLASAKFIPSDSVNYKIPEIMTCTWTINKCVLENGELSWSDDAQYVFDGKNKYMGIESGVNDKLIVEYENNSGYEVGDYETIARFYPVDEDNYEAPAETIRRWSIKRNI